VASTYKGKSLRPGGGGRFARLVDQLRARGMSEKRARAVAATIGRRKYGSKQMAQWAAAGRKRRSRE
jgi:hypothetical protein